MSFLAAPLLWYGVISLAGTLFFPFTYRLFPNLPDRGYTLSRIAAWLLWGFIFWLLASLGVLQNSPIGIIFAFCLLLAGSFWAFRKIDHQEFVQWIRSNQTLILVSEGLFLLSFIAWIFLRSTNPEIVGTEKPMELAFINAILRSPAFPPHDPWLSGFAISYYYFGYVLVAMIARLAGTSGSISFNIAIALIFSLGALASYGVIYNLLKIRSNRDARQPGSTIYPLLGPLFCLFSATWKGYYTCCTTAASFWARSVNGDLTSAFWKWLDIKDLNVPPAPPFSWIPDEFWWWWRASRVIQDYDLAGNAKEIIQEFPFFSFLLADLHPHVLAIPFALLAVTLALNTLLAQPANPGLRIGPFLINLSWQNLLLVSSVAIGALGFLNTWDLPVYVAFFAGCYATGKAFYAPGSSKGQVYTAWIKDFLIVGFLTGLLGILLYLPFYLGFSSQASGLIINLVYPTRGAHLWVVFGGLIIFNLCYLVYLWLET